MARNEAVMRRTSPSADPKPPKRRENAELRRNDAKTGPDPGVKALRREQKPWYTSIPAGDGMASGPGILRLDASDMGALEVTVYAPPDKLQRNEVIRVPARMTGREYAGWMARIVRDYHGYVHRELDWRYSALPAWEACIYWATWYFPEVRRRDEDNLLGWLKALLDAVKSKGVIPDDDVVHARYGGMVEVTQWGLPHPMVTL